MKNFLRPIVSTCLTLIILLMVAPRRVPAQDAAPESVEAVEVEQKDPNVKATQPFVNTGAEEDAGFINKTPKKKAPETPRKMIILHKGEQQTISEKKRIGRIDGFNPKLIEIVPESPHAIQIKGKVEGTTELILELDDGTIQPVNIRVRTTDNKQSTVDDSDTGSTSAYENDFGGRFGYRPARNPSGGDATSAATGSNQIAKKKTRSANVAVEFDAGADVESSKKNTANDFGAIIKQLFPDAKLEIVPIQDSAIFLRGTVGTAEEVEQIEAIAEEFWPSVHNYMKSKETLRGATLKLANPPKPAARNTGAIYGVDLNTPDGTVIRLPGPPHIPNGRPAGNNQPSAANPPAAAQPAGTPMRVPVYKNVPPVRYTQPQIAGPRPGVAIPRSASNPPQAPKAGLIVDIPAMGQSYSVRGLGQYPTTKPPAQSFQSDVRALHADVKRLIDLLEKRVNRKPKSGGKEKETSQIPKQGKAVLFFTADWCGPCQKMQPMVQKLKREGYAIFPIKVDQDRELTREFEVTAIPELLQINNGKFVPGGRHTGVIGDNELRKLVRKLTNSHTAGDPYAPVQAKSSGYDLFVSDIVANSPSELRSTPFITLEQSAPGGNSSPSSNLDAAFNDPFSEKPEVKAKTVEPNPLLSN